MGTSTLSPAALARLTMLARASFVATIVTALSSGALLLVNVDVYLLNRPPLQLGDSASAALKATAVGGTALGVVAAIIGLVLRRINRRMAQKEEKHERAANIAGAVTDQLQNAPQQMYRLSKRQGCTFPITVTILGISLVVATITFTPSQQIALALDNPLSTVPIAAGPTSTPNATATLAAPTATPVHHALIMEFPIPTSHSSPDGITRGPDGNLWFVEAAGKQVGKITPTGVMTEFPVPGVTSQLEDITRGPDGNLWFTTFRDGKIGRVTPSGSITMFTVAPARTLLTGITAGPDGNLWYCRVGGPQGQSMIGRLTPSGTVTEFTSQAVTGPAAITRGPDGNLWFADSDAVGRITPSGAIAEFPLPDAATSPDVLTTGPDGNLWFTASDDATGTNYVIGRMTTAGSFALYPLGKRSIYSGQGLTAGPDGNVWLTDDSAIGRITPGGVLTEFPLSPHVTLVEGIFAAPDGNFWLTEPNENQIGVFAP